MPSSVILWMRYDPGARTLDIAFRGERGVYRYFDVPLPEWQAFCAAPSKGIYLNQVFKAHRYGYRKLSRSVVQSIDSAQGDAVVMNWGEWPDSIVS